MKSLRLDISGQCFGKWLALRVTRCVRQGAYWLCRCECGREGEVRVDHLRRGFSTQCKRCSAGGDVVKLDLDERILTMVFAFDAGDSRREDVRALAADARALIDELAETRRERDALKEAANFYVKELQEKAANARAAAFEEFREQACLCGPGLHYDIKQGDCVVCKTARALTKVAR